MTKELYSVAQVRALDERAIKHENITAFQLMQRAAYAAFESLQDMLSNLSSSNKSKILVVCGGGNNAGDGYMVALLAQEANLLVEVAGLVAIESLSMTAQQAAKEWQAVGGKVLTFDKVRLNQYSIIVDAILGTGLQREVSGEWKHIINSINHSDAPVLALDVPSGVDADTGQVLGAAIIADKTVTFVGKKKGLYTGQSVDYCGDIIYSDLQIPEAVFVDVPIAAQFIEPFAESNLPPRKPSTHKGQCGHAVIIGGGNGMLGAVKIAALGALRSGVGKVTVVTSPKYAALLSATQPEIMSYGIQQASDLEKILSRATVVAVGPGLGVSKWAMQLFSKALETHLPLIVDADGLNLLAKEPYIRENWLLTPHPGEAARLLSLTTSDIELDRFTAVQKIADYFDATVILKGAGSLVAQPADTGEVINVCRNGSPAMASGGMGDLLTGVAAGLVAQGIGLKTAANCATYLHARAGELASEQGQRGTIATDLLPYIRQLVNP